MNVIPKAKAKPYPKFSRAVGFFPRLCMADPTYDNTNPTTLGTTQHADETDVDSVTLEKKWYLLWWL